MIFKKKINSIVFITCVKPSDGFYMNLGYKPHFFIMAFKIPSNLAPNYHSGLISYQFSLSHTTNSPFLDYNWSPCFHSYPPSIHSSHSSQSNLRIHKKMKREIFFYLPILPLKYILSSSTSFYLHPGSSYHHLSLEFLQ